MTARIIRRAAVGHRCIWQDVKGGPTCDEPATVDLVEGVFVWPYCDEHAEHLTPDVTLGT